MRSTSLGLVLFSVGLLSCGRSDRREIHIAAANGDNGGRGQP